MNTTKQEVKHTAEEERARGIFRTEFQLIINGIIKDQIELTTDDIVKAFWQFHYKYPLLQFNLDNIWRIIK